MFLAKNSPAKNVPSEEFSGEECSDEECSDEEYSDEESSLAKYYPVQRMLQRRMFLVKNAPAKNFPPNKKKLLGEELSSAECS
jgi:hypothetical protein